ncbi:DUF433 domain-containing protein [Microbulbifer sp. DLAB2-AF]|uniref:DUF433 domain-containing protein n=1 Tax=Microbulbifer sp. DLAB2-AF TaxID=3243395 RepID=UPI004039A155
MDYQPYIEVDMEKRGGKACVKGTRIAVVDILQVLSAGMTTSEIIEDFPNLDETKIRAAIGYAADHLPKGDGG